MSRVIQIQLLTTKLIPCTISFILAYATRKTVMPKGSKICHILLKIPRQLIGYIRACSAYEIPGSCTVLLGDRDT